MVRAQARGEITQAFNIQHFTKAHKIIHNLKRNKKIIGKLLEVKIRKLNQLTENTIKPTINCIFSTFFKQNL